MIPGTYWVKEPPVIDAGTRLKYSNHGFGLIGLIIEAITGESYADFLKREIIDAAGLTETTADMPLPRGTPFARGHTESRATTAPCDPTS